MHDLHNALHWWYIIQHNTIQYTKHNTQKVNNKIDEKLKLVHLAEYTGSSANTL